MRGVASSQRTAGLRRGLVAARAGGGARWERQEAVVAGMRALVARLAPSVFLHSNSSISSDREDLLRATFYPIYKLNHLNLTRQLIDYTDGG